MTPTFAIIGDTQQTLLVESLIFGRESNPQEQKTLIAALANDKPDFVVHLGDMVAWGANPLHWKYFDSLMAPVTSAGIPIYPVLGNHDYYHPRNLASANIQRRFPHLAEKTWYSKVFGDLGMIWLDSNRFHLGASRWHEQTQWFGETLARLEGDSAITGILVFDHHPPHTNSKVNHDAKYLQKDIVRDFVGSTKTLAFFSGHAQGYEHFQIQGKDFIVSGGGGGPRVKYHQGTHARHQDLFRGAEPRPLNYLLMTSEPSEMKIIAKGLQRSANNVMVFDEVILRK